MGVCVQSTRVITAPVCGAVPTQTHPTQRTVLPGTVWFPLCLPSSPAPFLLSPEPGNFPHFHPAMMFSSLKSPSRPHPPECSARAHGRLLLLGMTTFPSRPHLHHQDLGALYSPTRRAPSYTSPGMRPTRPSSRRPGTLPGSCAWGRFPEAAVGQHAGRRRAGQPERSGSSVCRRARSRPRAIQVHRGASYPSPAGLPGSARTPRSHGPGQAADPSQDALPGNWGRSPRRPRGSGPAPVSRAPLRTTAPARPSPAPPASTSRSTAAERGLPGAAGRRTRVAAAPAFRSVREGVTEHFRSVLRGTASRASKMAAGAGPRASNHFRFRCERPTRWLGCHVGGRDVSGGNSPCCASAFASSGSGPRQFSSRTW